MREFGRWLDSVEEQYRFADEEGTTDIFLDRRQPRFLSVVSVTECPQRNL